MSNNRANKTHNKNGAKDIKDKYIIEEEQTFTLLTRKTPQTDKSLPILKSFPLSSFSINSYKNLPPISLPIRTHKPIKPLKKYNQIIANVDSKPASNPSAVISEEASSLSSNCANGQIIFEKTDVSLNENSEITTLSKLKKMQERDLLDFLASQTVGRNLLFKTSFGTKLKVYVDYAASGQDLKFILDEMAKITELYANTHSESSYTGFYMNHLLNQAEEIIMNECKADTKDYFIIDGGAGSTYGIEMVQKILGTYIPPKTKELLKDLCNEKDFKMDFDQMKEELRKQRALPTVIVSPYEHHSNEITWRKQFCDVVEVPFRLDGFMDLVALENMLQEYSQKGPIICSFSAGSNVTGIKTDVTLVATMCKKYEAICLFDYAGVASYVPIDLSQRNDKGILLIDGVYISPHKFLGGPGTCGILILNKAVYDITIKPTHGGGGTVDYVGRFSESYVANYSEREKSGTPGILQIIKCGLAFQLKGLLQDTITKYEHDYNARFFERMCKNKNFHLLGQPDEEARVSIISFNIWMEGHRGKRFIHHNLVVRLLSDIFGIQGRSGCGCAGPYGLYLLGLSDEESSELEFIVEKHPELDDSYQVMSLKLGWARITLHYTLKNYELEYILFALEFLCKYGGRFLPVYKMDACSGNWTHVSENWDIPTLKIGEILNEVRAYAKDEESRQAILEKQKNDAMELLKILPESKGFDSIEEFGESCKFYVEKGNIMNRTAIEEKFKTLITKTSFRKYSCKQNSILP